MTQMPYFNLLDEPWLPVSLGDGRVVRVGLLEAFTRSSEISLLAETAPPSLVAEYRLLLAILHRALSAAFPDGWKDKDRARWYREGLPVDKVCEYLQKWKERFWLFHPEYPFMQVAALATSQELGDEKNHKPWMQITADCPDAHSPVLFDHSYYDAPRPILPHEAIAHLLGYLQFAPPGTLRVVKESRPSDGAGKGGPLRKAAALVALGDNLSETLLLNLAKRDSNSDADLPAWERGKPELATLAKATLATGGNDRYTRQTRAVLFLRENDDYIKKLLFTSGLELNDDDRNAPDPMVVYDSKNKLITFEEGRSIWRDLPALASQKSGTGTLNNALHLHEWNGGDSDTFYQPVLLMGMASGESGGAAKNARWRSERIEVPLSIKGDYDTHNILSDLVNKSEKLHGKLEDLAMDMLTNLLADSHNKEALKEARPKAKEVFRSGGFEASYFSVLEKSFPQLMDCLKERDLDAAVEEWGESLRAASQQAWQQLKLSMGFSSRSLRAQVKFEPRFYGVLKKFCPKPQLEKGLSV